MIFGIAYDTWINVGILTLFNCFWFWYLATTKSRLDAEYRKKEIKRRIRELGHDPARHRV